MKIQRILAVILLAAMCLTILVSCAQSDVPEGYQLVACEGDSFRLYVPASWVSNAASGLTGAFYSLNENASVACYRADDAGEMTLEEYLAYTEEKLSASLDGYLSLGREKAILGGQPALKTMYSALFAVSAEGTEEAITYKFLQVTAQYRGETYVLLYSAPEAYYDTHIEVVEGNDKGQGIIPYFKFAEAYVREEPKKFDGEVVAPDGMKLISTDERAYRFFVPESWVVNQRAEISAAYVSESDSSNVSLQMHMTEDESVSVADFFASCAENYETIFDEFELLAEEDIKMDGIAAKKFVYRAVIGGVEYRQMQAIVQRGAVYYVLTYTALPELFDSHLADVEKMIDAFDIR